MFVGASHNLNLAIDVAVSCMEHAISNFKDHYASSEKFATLIFPLLLVQPKVRLHLHRDFIYVQISPVAFLIYFLSFDLYISLTSCNNNISFFGILLFIYLMQTLSLNLKALELAKKVKWPIYNNLVGLPIPEVTYRLHKHSCFFYLLSK